MFSLVTVICQVNNGMPVPVTRVSARSFYSAASCTECFYFTVIREVQVAQVNDHTESCWIPVCKTKECDKTCATDGSDRREEDV
jgi:hypothetical protein